ncbi:MAG: alpha/beta fold hydrolase [Acetobacteraceae bacterium]
MRHRFTPGVEAEITGSGPTVWLLHSLLADAGSCRPLAALLAATHRVVLPDLPGFGGSPRAAGLEGVADRIALAIEEDGGPVALLGNGYGSFVALTAALRHPGVASRLILAGTGAAFSEPGRAAFRGMAAAAGSKGLAAIADTAMRRLFAPAFQDANPALLAERRARFLATDPAVFTEACAALAELDLRDRVGSVRVPVQVLVGALDEATPPAMAEELAALLPQARLEILPGLAHVPQLQDAPRFLTAIAAFLGEETVRTPGALRS